MIFIYEKNSQYRIDWKKYNPMFVMEICKGIDVKLCKIVALAHSRKIMFRHWFENRLIKKCIEICNEEVKFT
jgi:hypothetical protein